MSTNTHTEDIWDILVPCEASEYCDHKICHVCRRPMRNTAQKVADHPGTFAGHITGRLCDRCMVHGHKHYVRPPKEHRPKLRSKPDPFAFKFEGDVRMSDHEMERIEREYPAQYEWFMARRERIDNPEVRRRFYRLTNHVRHYGTEYLEEALRDKLSEAAQ